MPPLKPILGYSFKAFDNWPPLKGYALSIKGYALSIKGYAPLYKGHWPLI